MAHNNLVTLSHTNEDFLQEYLGDPEKTKDYFDQGPVL